MTMTRTRRTALVAGTSTGIAAVITIGALIAFGVPAGAAPTKVGLGTADSFGVLAGSGITNTGPTTITGDIGTFPNTSVTGSASVTLSGTNHAGDSVTQGAKSDLVTAYTTAAGQGPTTAISADPVGTTLQPGVYNSASEIGLSGVLTLDGGGDPAAVWVFQAGSSLTTASGSTIALVNGAQACHVYWQVGSSATLGTNSTFRGTIMALTSISLQTGARVDGRVLARNGAVTLDTNTITRSACITGTTPTATATPTSTTTPGPTTPASSGTPGSGTSSSPATQVSATPRGAVGAGDTSTG